MSNDYSSFLEIHYNEILVGMLALSEPSNLELLRNAESSGLTDGQYSDVRELLCADHAKQIFPYFLSMTEFDLNRVVPSFNKNTRGVEIDNNTCELCAGEVKDNSMLLENTKTNCVNIEVDEVSSKFTQISSAYISSEDTCLPQKFISTSQTDESCLSWLGNLLFRFNEICKDYDPFPNFIFPMIEARVMRAPSYTPPPVRTTSTTSRGSSSANSQRAANDNIPRAANSNNPMSRNNNFQPSTLFNSQRNPYAQNSEPSYGYSSRPNYFSSSSSYSNAHSGTGYSSSGSSGNGYSFNTPSQSSFSSSWSSADSLRGGSSSWGTGKLGGSSSSYTLPSSTSYFDRPSSNLKLNNNLPFTTIEIRPLADYSNHGSIGLDMAREVLAADMDNAWNNMLRGELEAKRRKEIEEQNKKIENLANSGITYDQPAITEEKWQAMFDSIIHIYNMLMGTCHILSSEGIPIDFGYIRHFLKANIPVLENALESGFVLEMLLQKAYDQSKFHHTSKKKNYNADLSGGGNGRNGTDTEEQYKKYKKYEKYKTASGRYECARAESPIWNNAQNLKYEYKTNGLKGRKREYYRWDETHKDVEVYDKNTLQVGSRDPVTGKMYRAGNMEENKYLRSIT